MNTDGYIRLGRLTALFAFLIGTVIFLLYYLTSKALFLFVGYAYILLVGLIYLAVFISLINRQAKDPVKRKRIRRTYLIMLLNIPVLLAYSWFVIVLLGNMRITFTNHTGMVLTDINIVGCGGGSIERLAPGESEEVWVKITGDCSLELQYFADGESKVEVVAGYITPNMGQKLDHKIDGKDKELML